MPESDYGLVVTRSDLASMLAQFTDYNVELQGHGNGWTFKVYKDGTVYKATSKTPERAVWNAAQKAMKKLGSYADNWEAARKRREME